MIKDQKIHVCSNYIQSTIKRLLTYNVCNIEYNKTVSAE